MAVLRHPALRCVNCHAPADVRHSRSGEDLCERCARMRTDGERGEAFAALSILDATIAALRCAEMSDREILTAVKVRLAADDLDAFTGRGGDGGSTPRWQCGYDYDDRLIRLEGTS
jgi:hypothetical protein